MEQFQLQVISKITKVLTAAGYYHQYTLHKNALTQLILSVDKNSDQDWIAYKSLESIIASSTLFSLSDGNPCCSNCFNKYKR
jgi:hypothetical protein